MSSLFMWLVSGRKTAKCSGEWNSFLGFQQNLQDSFLLREFHRFAGFGERERAGDERSRINQLCAQQGDGLCEGAAAGA